jgi:hypothetical protein
MKTIKKQGEKNIRSEVKPSDQEGLKLNILKKRTQNLRKSLIFTNPSHDFHKRY